MESLRKYGKPPYRVAVVHGGPGAAGEMAPVARKLSGSHGILEPLQTAASIEGQLAELHDSLCFHGELPLTLIGHSWGAWLAYIFAARYPQLVAKLILVGSGPFEGKYASGIMQTRLDRLDDAGRQRVNELGALMEKAECSSESGDMNKALAEFGRLMSKTDTFDMLPDVREEVQLDMHIHQSVWQEASELRRSGRLLELGRDISCPVLAVHGDYDPHPYLGVVEPLARVLADFRHILLERCGHEPWIERYARNEFFQLLERELIKAV